MSKKVRRRWKITLLVLFIIAMLGGAVAARIVTAAPPIDGSTLCRLNHPVEEAAVVLVDTTDPLSTNQQRQLRAAIYGARDRTPPGAKLIVLLIDPAAPHDPRELIAKCNPGSGKNVNPLFTTVIRVDQRWKKAFGAPIDRVVKELSAAPSAKSSPIMEAIAAASERPDFDGRIPRRLLVIVSDLLELAVGPGGFSQYRIGNQWAAFRRSRLNTEIQPDLTNCDVDIVYLVRPADAKFQTVQQRQFWREWLKRAGASSVRFVGIPSDKREMAPHWDDGGARVIQQRYQRHQWHRAHHVAKRPLQLEARP